MGSPPDYTVRESDMNHTKIAAVAFALAVTATASGSALGADYGRWSVKLAGQSYGGNLIVPAKFKHRQKFGSGFRHGSRRGFRQHRGHRHGYRHRGGHGYDALFFSLALPFLLFPHYGHRHDYGYDDDHTHAPPVYAPSAGPAPAPAPGESPYCREITMEIVIDGVEQPAHGTACQQADGSWKITN